MKYDFWDNILLYIGFTGLLVALLISATSFAYSYPIEPNPVWIIFFVSMAIIILWGLGA